MDDGEEEPVVRASPSSAAQGSAPHPVSLLGSFHINGALTTVRGASSTTAYRRYGPIFELTVVTEEEAGSLGAGWEVIRCSKPKPAPVRQAAGAAAATGTVAAPPAAGVSSAVVAGAAAALGAEGGAAASAAFGSDLSSWAGVASGGVSAGAGAAWPSAAATAAASLTLDSALPPLATHAAGFLAVAAAAAPGTPLAAAPPRVAEAASGGVSESKDAVDDGPVADSAIQGTAAATTGCAAGAEAAPTAAASRFLALRRQRRVYHLPGGAVHPNACVDGDDDPIVDVLVVSRSTEDAGRPWSELVPRGYVVVERTSSGAASAALAQRGDAAVGAGGEIFIAYLRRSAWQAAASESVAASAALTQQLPPPLPAPLVGVDILWLDDDAKEVALPGYRVIERTSQTLLSVQCAAALPHSPGFTARSDPVGLVGATTPALPSEACGGPAGAGQKPRAIVIAVRFETAERPAPLPDCPLTALYQCEDGLGLWLELTAEHVSEGALVAGRLGCPASALSAVLPDARAMHGHAARGAADKLVAPAFLEAAGSVHLGNFRSLSALRLLGVAVPASAAARLTSVSSGCHLTPGMLDSLSHVPPPSMSKDDAAADLAVPEPVYLMGLWKTNAAAAGSEEDIGDLLPQPCHAVFAADGATAVGSFLVTSGAAYPWRLHAHHVLRVAFKRDVHTLFRRGRVVRLGASLEGLICRSRFTNFPQCSCRSRPTSSPLSSPFPTCCGLSSSPTSSLLTTDPTAAAVGSARSASLPTLSSTLRDTLPSSLLAWATTQPSIGRSSVFRMCGWSLRSCSR